jgi:N-hydroxyarylamine O-acetyltransferase
MVLSSPISESLLDRVLPALGLSSRPEPTLESLRAIYAAWCQRVPFDNVRKLVHLHRQEAGALPGTEADDFFEAWLRYHTGGTCWSGANALYSLLSTLGFDVERGIATMMAAPNLPPNHGSVRVRLDGGLYLVDTAILSGEPLRLDGADESEVTHPAWGVRAVKSDGLWHVLWRALHKTDGFECRFEWFGADHDAYRRRYEQTRDWSPFNYQLTARRNRGDEVIGMTFGNAVALRADGRVEQHPIDDAERRRLLIEDFGISEEIVAQLPGDQPTPPPPGSKTAAAAAS